jgi:hypothetical protein
MDPGCYVVRQKVTPAQLVKKLERRRNGLTGRDSWLWTMAAQNPDWIVFRLYRRGVSQFSGKWETSSLILLPPDKPLREIKSKPGFSR